MQKLVESLSGRKTYGLAVLLVLLALCDAVGVIPEQERLAVYSVVVAGLAATLRAAVSKALPDLEFDESEIEHVVMRSQDDGTIPVEQPRPRDLAGAGMLLLCLFLPTIAVASDARIVGPKAVPVAGYPCELHIQGNLPEGTKYVWDYIPKTPGVSLIDDAQRYGPIVRLNTMAGTYQLIAAVTPPGTASPELLYYDFHAPGVPYVPPTPPAPQPVPPPQPHPVDPVQPQPADPVFAPGRFGFAEATYREVMAVSSENRRTETVCLASRIQDLVNGLKSGTIKTPQAAVDAIAGAFDGCLSEKWDAARNKLTDRVAELLTSRQLRTMQDWQDLATEALAGLNEAKQR